MTNLVTSTTIPTPTSTSGTVVPAGLAAPTAAFAQRTASRLRNGELRRRIARYLAEHPAEEVTPGQIARHLDRSSGAVGNALATLTARGEAEQTSTRPARYRATTTTVAAAATTTNASATKAATAPATAASTNPGTTGLTATARPPEPSDTATETPSSNSSTEAAGGAGLFQDRCFRPDTPG